jgi:hypothetical protein
MARLRFHSFGFASLTIPGSNVLVQLSVKDTLLPPSHFLKRAVQDDGEGIGAEDGEHSFA